METYQEYLHSGQMEASYRAQVYQDYLRRGRFVFAILPELYRPETGYMAVTVAEGFLGFYQSKLFCGHDYEMALWYAQHKNEEMGISAKVATKMINDAFALTPLQPWNALPL